MAEELCLSIDINAPAITVWQAVTDWERQREWMLGTTVRVTAGDGRSVGSRLTARTYGVTDTMEITAWHPPRRCVVRHTGRVVRGSGVFEVEPLDADRSRFVWREILDLPLVALGRLGFPLVRPVVRAGVRVSLNRLARTLTR